MCLTILGGLRRIVASSRTKETIAMLHSMDTLRAEHDYRRERLTRSVRRRRDPRGRPDRRRRAGLLTPMVALVSRVWRARGRSLEGRVSGPATAA